VSTYTASKIVKAVKPHSCERCDKPIPKGTRYLRYELSQGFTSKLHLACADVRSENNSLVYDCAALRAHFRMEQRSAL
jgi:hypothetical protein